MPIVRHHHEAWDGTGYPDGLKGTNIPLGARILSVVDCYDALTSDRPYRSRMGTEEAIAILREDRCRLDADERDEQCGGDGGSNAVHLALPSEGHD